MCPAQALGGLDALVRIARWHADVSDDDIRGEFVDRAQQRVQVAADAGHLQLGLGRQQSANPLADEVVVLGQHQPDRHEQRIRPVTETEAPLVLIVDDGPANRKLARDLLALAGLRTIEAATVAEATALSP